MSDPSIAIVAVATAVAAWWLKGAILKGLISGLEERLKLAAEKVAWANEARDEVERQFQALKVEISVQPENSVIAARVATLEAALEKLSTANNAVSSAMGVAIGSSAATGIDNSLANTPLTLRVEAEEIKDKKE